MCSFFWATLHPSTSSSFRSHLPRKDSLITMFFLSEFCTFVVIYSILFITIAFSYYHSASHQIVQNSFLFTVVFLEPIEYLTHSRHFDKYNWLTGNPVSSYLKNCCFIVHSQKKKKREEREREMVKKYLNIPQNSHFKELLPI